MILISRCGIGETLLNKFLSLHILTINRVINLPTVSFEYSELTVGAERGAGEPKIGWSGEQESKKNDGAEWSAEVARTEQGLQK